MNTKITVKYECQFCDREFDEREECFLHELKEHIGISREEYQEWYELHRRVEVASHAKLVSCNKTTRKLFDDAVDKMVKFEEEHNISGVHIAKYQEFIINQKWYIIGR